MPQPSPALSWNAVATLTSLPFPLHLVSGRLFPWDQQAGGTWAPWAVLQLPCSPTPCPPWAAPLSLVTRVLALPAVFSLMLSL